MENQKIETFEVPRNMFRNSRHDIGTCRAFTLTTVQATAMKSAEWATNAKGILTDQNQPASSSSEHVRTSATEVTRSVASCLMNSARTLETSVTVENLERCFKRSR